MFYEPMEHTHAIPIAWGKKGELQFRRLTSSCQTSQPLTAHYLLTVRDTIEFHSSPAEFSFYLVKATVNPTYGIPPSTWFTNRLRSSYVFLASPTDSRIPTARPISSSRRMLSHSHFDSPGLLIPTKFFRCKHNFSWVPGIHNCPKQMFFVSQ